MKKSFRIYPTRQDDMWRLDNSAWFEVNVFPDRKAFIRYTKLKNAMASTRGKVCKVFRNIFNGRIGMGKEMDKIENAFPKGKIGEMNFMEGHLDDEILIHECVHAMFRVVSLYADVVHLWLHEDVMTESEEYMCFMVSAFKKQIAENL